MAEAFGITCKLWVENDEAEEGIQDNSKQLLLIIAANQMPVHLIFGTQGSNLS